MFGHPTRTARLLASALATGAVAAATIAVVAVSPAGAAPVPFLSHFSTSTEIASTVPGNGDVNPYGVANVPFSTGALVGGDTLVSNFNSSNNLQGTGTTIVQVAPNGSVSLFAQIDPSLPGCPGGVGLTTALSVLNDGYVVVGSLPVTDDGSGTPEAGCLIVLNSNGVPVETWAGNGINGPWDMTSVQLFGPFAQLFVTNVLNGTVAAAPNIATTAPCSGSACSIRPAGHPCSSPRTSSRQASRSSSTRPLSSSARPASPSSRTGRSTSPTTC
jgi:hypothetical protein